MKNLNKQIKLSYLVGFNLILFIVLSILYIYFKELVQNSSNDINLILSGISIVFLLIGLSILIVSSLIYFFLKHQNNKLLRDVEALSEHINEISEKDYQSKVEIKHYQEFLQISILLKNILKRLNKKD